MQPSVKVLVFT